MRPWLAVLAASIRESLATLALLTLASGLALLTDLYVWPQLSHPAVYAVPVLVAALRMSPRGVCAVASLAVVGEALDAVVSHASPGSSALNLAALLLTFIFAINLALQREETIRNRNEAAWRAQVSEQHRRELAELIRAVSHDIRQPLTSVSFLAQALEHELAAGQSSNALDHVAAIMVSLERTDRLIADLVDSTRPESERVLTRPESVDLVGFVRALLERWRGVLAVERIVVDAPDLAAAYVDPDHLERILGNLLGNALKFSAPGTPVRVTIVAGPRESTLSVADRGIGIAPADLPHLFERGYRTREAMRTAAGTGLGLYITRRLVEANGGQIRVESAPARGTSFHVTLPANGKA